MHKPYSITQNLIQACDTRSERYGISYIISIAIQRAALRRRQGIGGGCPWHTIQIHKHTRLAWRRIEEYTNRIETAPRVYTGLSHNETMPFILEHSCTYHSPCFCLASQIDDFLFDLKPYQHGKLICNGAPGCRFGFVQNFRKLLIFASLIDLL